MESFVWWLLPLFVLHEVEEIVWLPGWTERHRGELVARFPRIAGRLPRMSRGRIAWIAGEEGLLLSGLTGWSVASGDPVPWLVGFGGFSLHIGVHIGQWAVLRSYIPAIATSWICLPYCIWGVLLSGVIRFGGRADRLVACGRAACRTEFGRDVPLVWAGTIGEQSCKTEIE